MKNSENALEEIRNRVANRYYEKKGNVYIQNDMAWMVKFAEGLLDELHENDSKKGTKKF